MSWCVEPSNIHMIERKRKTRRRIMKRKFKVKGKKERKKKRKRRSKQSLLCFTIFGFRIIFFIYSLFWFFLSKLSVRSTQIQTKRLCEREKRELCWNENDINVAKGESWIVKMNLTERMPLQFRHLALCIMCILSDCEPWRWKNEQMK